jgi:hypothetical protein
MITTGDNPTGIDPSLPAQNAGLTSISPAVSRIINSIPPSVLSARVRTLTQSAMASPGSAAAAVAAHHSAVAAAVSGNDNMNTSDNHVNGNGNGEQPSELAAAARALRAAAEANDDEDSSAGDEHRKMRKNTREKQRRQEINDKFDHLCLLLGMKPTTTTTSGGIVKVVKPERHTILAECISAIVDLQSTNATLHEEKIQLTTELLALASVLQHQSNQSVAAGQSSPATPTGGTSSGSMGNGPSRMAPSLNGNGAGVPNYGPPPAGRGAGGPRSSSLSTPPVGQLQPPRPSGPGGRDHRASY